MKKLFLLHIILLNSVLLYSQNVGIGTSTPDAKLEIGHNGTLSYPQLHLHEEGNDLARIKFDNTNGSNSWTIGAYIGSNPRSDRLNFLNGNIELLSLTGEGRLGLGVGASPKTDLHIGPGKRILFGSDTSGTGDKLMFLPDLHAFRVGTVWPGASSTYWNRDSIGLYSFASGWNTRAQGLGSTAMGRDTEATNDYAFASGLFSNADGQYSTALGHNSDAFGKSSTALGHSCDAEKDYSFAVGYFAEAQAESSMAIGNYTLAQSINSTALGSFNVGGGNATQWLDGDPILEIGVGRTSVTRKNALTILKDGRHGIITAAPKANLHVADNGTSGQGTIVAILEANVSDRPILQFSETSVGDSDSGMSIEYDGSGSGSNNKMHINKTGGGPMVTFGNDGKVGIGVTSPTFPLHLPNNPTSGEAKANRWSVYSDQRIKSDILSINYGLSEIMLLNPFSYQQHHSEFHDSKLLTEDESVGTIGFLAQEVYQVIPEAVSKPEDENEQLWGMDYDKLIPVLVKGMQQQQEQISMLKNEIELLRSIVVRDVEHDANTIYKSLVKVR